MAAIARLLTSLVVWYAISLHVIWAVCFLADAETGGVTAIYALSSWTGRNAASVVLLVVAALAGVGIATRTNNRVAALLMLPQQFVLFLCAGGVMKAMWLGRFADGVQRSHWFLIADQTPAILTALYHMVAVIRVWSRG